MSWNATSTFMSDSIIIGIWNLDTIQKATYSRICLWNCCLVSTQCKRYIIQVRKPDFQKFWKFSYENIPIFFCNLLTFLQSAEAISLSKNQKNRFNLLFFIKQWFLHSFSCDFRKLFFYDSYLYYMWCMEIRCNNGMDFSRWWQRG